uniref:Uncharacterized protein n=1 Tax=Tanacetum cinerariifolium TaxID=118510 RepID=A0A6L2JFS5_TANCI|nr:hypothetical protein [Tanacetum cinerariifolium]
MESKNDTIVAAVDVLKKNETIVDDVQIFVLNKLASRRHVAASYWTAASDVAATSARSTSTTVGQRRSTPPATGQRRRITVVIRGQRWRSTTVNAADHRSTVAVNDGRRWRTTVDCRWTTVDHHWTTSQRWLVGRSEPGPGRIWIGSGSCPPRGMPRVPTWQLTWIISTRRELNSGPHG